MPYGISDDVWRRLPPEDRANVIAGATKPVAGATAAAPATPPPPPASSLVYGVAPEVFRGLPPEDRAALVAASLGQAPPSIGALTSPPAPPGSGAVLVPVSGQTTPPNPTAGSTLSPRAASVGPADPSSKRSLAIVTQPSSAFPPPLSPLKHVVAEVGDKVRHNGVIFTIIRGINAAGRLMVQVNLPAWELSASVRATRRVRVTVGGRVVIDRLAPVDGTFSVPVFPGQTIGVAEYSFGVRPEVGPPDDTDPGEAEHLPSDSGLGITLKDLPGTEDLAVDSSQGLASARVVVGMDGLARLG